MARSNCRTRPIPGTSMRYGRELDAGCFAAARRAVRARRPTRSRSTWSTPASRRSAPRRTTSISSCNPARRAASRSRPRIRPISAPSSRTNGRPTSPTATCRAIPSFKFEKRRLTIYETEEWQLVGLTFPSFWRPQPGAGARRQPHRDRLPSAAALDPLSGARRRGAGALSGRRLLARAAAAAANLRWSAYGSSFLIGPVETDGRPFVDIRDMRSIRRRAPSP